MPDRRTPRNNTIHMGIVLRKFAENGPGYVQAIAAETHLNRTTVLGIVHRFEADGWLERTDGPQPEIRRGPGRQYYELTDLGREMAARAENRLSVLAQHNTLEGPSGRSSLGLT